MEAYIGQIILFAGNYAPEGWLLCNGQTLAVADYQPLFVLIGTAYGGDGMTTFKLPDLRGRVPIGLGAATAHSSARVLGQVVGEEAVTLTAAQMPVHTHALEATTAAATTNVPTGNLLAAVPAGNVFYLDPPNPVPTGVTIQTLPLAPGAVGQAFGSGPHNNIMPSLVLNYIICTSGIFPTPD